MKNQKSKIKNQNFNLKFKTFKFLIALLTFNFLLFTFPHPAYAASSSLSPCPATGGGIDIGECFGFGQFSSLGQLVSQLVLPLFSITTALVTVYFLWGAFNYLKAGSSKEEVAGAKNMLTHAIIGFIILIFTFLILQFLLSSLFGIKDQQLFK